jgi:hypothetical protein
MGLGQIQQLLKRSPMVLLGAFLGSVLMYTLGHSPHFIEVNWGPEGKQITIDSRPELLCDSEIADSSQ